MTTETLVRPLTPAIIADPRWRDGYPPDDGQHYFVKRGDDTGKPVNVCVGAYHGSIGDRLYCMIAYGELVGGNCLAWMPMNDQDECWPW